MSKALTRVQEMLGPYIYQTAVKMTWFDLKIFSDELEPRYTLEEIKPLWKWKEYLPEGGKGFIALNPRAFELINCFKTDMNAVRSEMDKQHPEYWLPHRYREANTTKWKQRFRGIVRGDAFPNIALHEDSKHFQKNMKGAIEAAQNLVLLPNLKDNRVQQFLSFCSDAKASNVTVFKNNS